MKIHPRDVEQLCRPDASEDVVYTEVPGMVLCLCQQEVCLARDTGIDSDTGHSKFISAAVLRRAMNFDKLNLYRGGDETTNIDRLLKNITAVSSSVDLDRIPNWKIFKTFGERNKEMLSKVLDRLNKLPIYPTPLRDPQYEDKTSEYRAPDYEPSIVVAEDNITAVQAATAIEEAYPGRVRRVRPNIGNYIGLKSHKIGKPAPIYIFTVQELSKLRLPKCGLNWSVSFTYDPVGTIGKDENTRRYYPFDMRVFFGRNPLSTMTTTLAPLSEPLEGRPFFISGEVARGWEVKTQEYQMDKEAETYANIQYADGATIDTNTEWTKDRTVSFQYRLGIKKCVDIARYGGVIINKVKVNGIYEGGTKTRTHALSRLPMLPCGRIGGANTFSLDQNYPVIYKFAMANFSYDDVSKPKRWYSVELAAQRAIRAGIEEGKPQAIAAIGASYGRVSTAQLEAVGVELNPTTPAPSFTIPTSPIQDRHLRAQGIRAALSLEDYRATLAHLMPMPVLPDSKIKDDEKPVEVAIIDNLPIKEATPTPDEKPVEAAIIDDPPIKEAIPTTDEKPEEILIPISEMFEAVAALERSTDEDPCNERNVANTLFNNNRVPQTLYKDIVEGLKGLSIQDFLHHAIMLGYIGTDGRAYNLRREEKWLRAAYRNKPLDVEGIRNNNLFRLLYGFGMDFGLDRLNARAQEILAKSTLPPKEKNIVLMKAASTIERRERFT